MAYPNRVVKIMQLNSLIKHSNSSDKQPRLVVLNSTYAWNNREPCSRLHHCILTALELEKRLVALTRQRRGKSLLAS